ncbi:sialate O-acetylesterase [Stieleria sp. JC731]|uniref:sialate O-acetylesterase n=1 Tax=Pirellulaceae TaxID=2691357 RepID=UPI001E34C126|nr:sialate O-acetylesterase [Stieleria sp. JC731]MCC9599066.1 sialate O-acetylesterase [Stieleria sp. JC731]
MKIRSLLLMFGMAMPSVGFAELTVPHFISDHMVIQRDRDVRLWGSADPGDTVTISFKEKSVDTKADENGKWSAALASGAADADGAMLKISSGDESIEIEDVLVGEVWFASGQSNMVFTMNRVPAYADIIAKTDLPKVRFFNAPTVTSVLPQDDIDGEWSLANSKSVPQYSAVAFFFAKKLHEELDVPVGVIKSAWGGKPVETFTSREALRTNDGTAKLVAATEKADAGYDASVAQQQYEQRMEQWKQAMAAYREKPADQRGRAPRRPATPKRPLDTEGQPGVLFNSMIHPFVGYTIRGAIWYQGEGNAKPNAVPYDQTLPLLITDWRQRWHDDFSFYFVQLANFRDPTTQPGNNDPWPLLQDRMRRVVGDVPKTGMAVINDVGEAKDIHPKNKHDVGERLARWALAKDYDMDLVYSGPLFRSSEAKNGAITITFDHVGEGLKSRDEEPLQRFEVAGKDQAWHWADAEIIGKDSVRVHSDDVSVPVAVRYAWAANPEGANLVNSEGLPASVFRTDDWQDVEPQTALSARERLLLRRDLGAKIKQLATKRSELKRGTDQFNEVVAEQKKLQKQLQELSSRQ